jgi:hypothetical protein
MTRKSKDTERPTAEVINWDRFKSKRTAEERAAAKPKPKKTEKPKRAPAAEPFVRLPYARFMQAYGKLSAAAFVVAIELDHLHFTSFEAHKNPVTLTNKDLKAVGMHRNTKAKALRQLRDAGLISFTQDGQGSYVVTLTWYPVL